MEGKFAKVSDNSCRVMESRRERAARFATLMARNAISRLSAYKSSAVKLGKRKKPDVCKAKCKSCKLASRRSLVRYYGNFMKSGLPKRLMFFQNGVWVDHELEVVGLVRKDFEHKKAAIEVRFKSYHLVLDFVHMVQYNFKTTLEQPIAWIDERNCCYFPEIYTDLDEPHRHYSRPEIQKNGGHEPQEIKLQIEIELNGVGDSKLEYCGESSPLVKRIKVARTAEIEDSCDKVSDVRRNEVVGENQYIEKNLDVEVEKAKLDMDPNVVKEMFLKGMESTTGTTIVNVSPNSDYMCQGRLELFLKQIEIMKKYRGNPNVCYAWLSSSKETTSGIMTYGLGYVGFRQIKSLYGTGLHLAPANGADASVNYCDVDENGVGHMVLCRIIMGNMEVVHRGSKQFHPSSENFDSGVDDPDNPQHYVVWSMNINTHIYPECVVSFKVPADLKGHVLKSNGNLDIVGVKSVYQDVANQCKMGAAIDTGSDHQSNITSEGSKERSASLSSSTPSLPKSPYMPFPMLFEAISKQVSQNSLKLLLAYYELFKNKIICREDFIKELRVIVGDTLLKSTLKGLSCKMPPNNADLMEPNQ